MEEEGKKQGEGRDLFLSLIELALKAGRRQGAGRGREAAGKRKGEGRDEAGKGNLERSS